VTLNDVEASVTRRLPVPELSDAELAARLASGDIVVFDVREADEFAQSHLAGARRIDPDLGAEAFRQQYAAELNGRVIVFYCAVGVRSGMMVARLQPVLAASGATAAYNLRGGIFRWRAAGRPLMAPSMSQPAPGATVHPYDRHWGLLLERTLRGKTLATAVQPNMERP
jgi:rhodanese-related sulfurtransferase